MKWLFIFAEEFTLTRCWAAAAHKSWDKFVSRQVFVCEWLLLWINITHLFFCVIFFFRLLNDRCLFQRRLVPLWQWIYDRTSTTCSMHDRHGPKWVTRQINRTFWSPESAVLCAHRTILSHPECAAQYARWATSVHWYTKRTLKRKIECFLLGTTDSNGNGVSCMCVTDVAERKALTTRRICSGRSTPSAQRSFVVVVVVLFCWTPKSCYSRTTFKVELN